MTRADHAPSSKAPPLTDASVQDSRVLGDSGQRVAGGDRATVDSLLDLVKEAAKREDPYDLGDIPDRFVDQIRRSPELLGPILESYESLAPGKEKEVLYGMLIDTVALDGGERVEVIAVAKSTSQREEDAGDWFRLLRDVGVRAPALRNQLLAHLPSLLDERNLSAAISSIVPQAVPAEEKAAVVNELSVYLNHAEASVRAATIQTIAHWGDDNHATVIEAGLGDASVDVRRAAATSALASNIQSDNIKSMLVVMLNDDGEDQETRIQAHNALSRYSLSGQDYDDFYEFSLRLDSPIKPED